MIHKSQNEDLIIRFFIFSIFIGHFFLERKLSLMTFFLNDKIEKKNNYENINFINNDKKIINSLFLKGKN